MTSRSLLSSAVLAAVLALPSAAGAATLTRDADGGLTWTSAPGTLGLIVAKDDGGVRFSTTDDQPDAEPAGCTDTFSGTVCEVHGPIRVNLGDGDDQGNVWDDLGVPVTLDGGVGDDKLQGVGGKDTLIGGPGNDTLQGQEGDDALDGGDGNDTVDGGAGSDQVLGGNGNDKLAGDGYKASSPDVIDGGPGVDLVADEWSDSAHDASGPADVFLDDQPNDGFAGEGDNVKNVEKLYVYTAGHTVGTDGADDLRRYVGPSGGSSVIEGRGGDDILMSDKADDKLDGGTGNDRVVGGFGNDTLVGGPGQDTLIGDSDGDYCNWFSCSLPFGNDTIDARDGEVDNVDCGVGTDTVYADKVDVVAPDCDNVLLADGPTQNTNDPDDHTNTPPVVVTKSTCKVPAKLKGLTYASAKAKLRKARCTTLRTKKVKSRTVRKGRVVSAVRKGRVVTVSISRGRR